MSALVRPNFNVNAFLKCQETTLKVCNFNMIPSDLCSENFRKIADGEMARGHLVWLIPTTVLANAVAIVLAPIAMLINFIASACLAIFAACTTDPQKKMLGNIFASMFFASGLSAITDNILTCSRRVFDPENQEKMTCVFDCVSQSLIVKNVEDGIVGILFNTLYDQLQGRISRVELERILRRAVQQTTNDLNLNSINGLIESGNDQGSEMMQNIQRELHRYLSPYNQDANLNLSFQALTGDRHLN